MSGQQAHNYERNLSLVLEFIHTFFGCPEIVETDDLIELGVLDSLRTAELVYFLENRLNIQLPARVLNEKNLRTSQSVAQMLTDFAADTKGQFPPSSF